MNDCLARPDALPHPVHLRGPRHREEPGAGQGRPASRCTRSTRKGALAISDAPLGFLPHGNDSDAAKRAAFTELQGYLLTDAGGDRRSCWRWAGARPPASA